MQMLSERGFNIHMFPMIPKRGRVFEGDYVRKNSKGETVFIAKEGSRWNLRCYKFMDWLSTKIRKRFDDNMFFMDSKLGLVKNIHDYRLSEYILLNRPDLFLNVLDGVQNRFSSNEKLARPYKDSYRIYYKEVAKDLGWEKKHVKKTIEMISNCKFKTKYNIKTAKTYGPRTEVSFKHGYSNINSEFESMFNINFTNSVNLELDVGDCFITFDTGFGICFLHNLFTGGYQLIDDNLYNLSESAQLVYRQRFFTYNKIPGTQLTMKWVLNFLNNTSPNISFNKNLFKKIINEIINIEGIEVSREINTTNYKITKGVKKEKKILQFK